MGEADRTGEHGNRGDDAVRVTEVADLVVRVVARIGRRFRPVRGDMGMGMLAALVSLDRMGPVRSGDLARHEEVAPATMTRMVSALVERGYARREPDPHDGRACLIVLTEDGRRAAAETRAGYAARVEEVLREMDEDQLRDAHEAMRLIQRSGLIG